MQESVRLYQRKPVSDSQTTIDFLVELVQHYNFMLNDFIVLLQPTCPLRTVDDINNAIILHRTKPHKSLVSAYRIDNQVYNADGIHLDALGLPVFQRNSSIYITRIRNIMEHRTLFYNQMHVYEMPKSRSIDINTRADFLECVSVMEGVRPYVDIRDFAKCHFA